MRIDLRRGCLAILAVLLMTLAASPQTHAAQDPSWDSSFSYHQDLTLPVPLSTPGLPGQPIDMLLTLEHPCWTQDENHTSIRVIQTHNGQPTELESEISNLTHKTPDQITSCRLVFILPLDLADTDTLSVYYDDAQTQPTNYPDHVKVTTGSLYLEPVSGYAINSNYYLITDDNTPIYTITYQGSFLFYTSTHYVTKLAPNTTTTTITPADTDMVANFEFKYYYGDPVDNFQTTANHPTTHLILHDGTLTTTIQITSASKDNTLYTTATYTYYHTPTTTQTRLRAHVDHTATQDCHVTPDASTDGTLAQLQCGGIQCATLPELSANHLYPYIHLHTTTGIQEYRLDPNPDYTSDPATALFAPTDNIDLTTPPWTSFDSGTTGTAHALLYTTTNILQSGTDEQNGIQTNAYESNTPNLPGFHNTLAVLQCNRNSADATGTQDLTIPADYHATYTAEFYTTTTGGYTTVQTEAALFPTLASLLPTTNTTTNTTTPTSPEHRYTLTIQIHHAPSLPFGEALSILRGHNYSYITTQVYQGTSLLATVPAVHIQLHQTTDTNTSLRDILDLKNSSLTKTSTLPPLPQGTYLIKILRNHPFSRPKTQYIGYAIVNLTDNTTIKIHCTRQATTTFQVNDQNGNPLSNADIRLTNNNQPITWGQTKNDGTLTLTAPRQPTPYNTLVIYKGFLIANQTIRLPLLNLLPRTHSFTVNLTRLTVTIRDTWGLPPDINLTPQVTSKLMYDKQNLILTPTGPGFYQITAIPEAPYNLQVQYQTFKASATIPRKSQNASLIFPAEYPISFRFVDARGVPLQGLTLSLQRENHTLNLNTTNDSATIRLPPGTYQLIVNSDSEMIARRTLQVTSPREITIVSSQDLTSIGFLLGGIIILGAMAVIGYWRREWAFPVIGATIAIIASSLWFPWWQISGSSAEVEISSRLFIFPTSLISVTKTPTVLSGELASLPAVFFTVMLVFIFGIIVGCGLIIASLVFCVKNHRRMMWVFWLGSLVSIAGSLILVLISISVLSEASVGSLLGSGSFQAAIPGEGIHSVPASWGLAMGFWVNCLVLILIGPVFYLRIRNKKRGRKTKS
jgi:hypothetical protein